MEILLLRIHHEINRREAAARQELGKCEMALRLVAEDFHLAQAAQAPAPGDQPVMRCTENKSLEHGPIT